MDTWIDEVMVIPTSFIQDTENNKTVTGGSILFMTDVTVFYVTMLRMITNHVVFATLGLINYFR